MLPNAILNNNISKDQQVTNSPPLVKNPFLKLIRKIKENQNNLNKISSNDLENNIHDDSFIKTVNADPNQKNYLIKMFKSLDIIKKPEEMNVNFLKQLIKDSTKEKIENNTIKKLLTFQKKKTEITSLFGVKLNVKILFQEFDKKSVKKFDKKEESVKIPNAMNKVKLLDSFDSSDVSISENSVNKFENTIKKKKKILKKKSLLLCCF